MKNDIVKNVGVIAGKAIFKVKKHSPEILLIAGTVGTIAGAVIACKQTLKITEILEESKNMVDAIHECRDRKEEDKYTDKDAKVDLIRVYANTGVKLVKLYSPALVIETVSITSILASHKILKDRNVALTAAYAALNKTFKDYRNRVIDRFGEEVDKQLRYNIKAIDVSEKISDKNGKEKEVVKTVQYTDIPENCSEYARFFDSSSRNWEKDPEYNLMFLRNMQSHANDLLKANGRLFLNEVYDLLDIPRTKAGQIVGWVYGENGVDNFVDFGIYQTHRPANRDFVNGFEPVILLDFNVDGNVWELM